MNHKHVVARRDLALLSKQGKHHSITITVEMPIKVNPMRWECVTTIEGMGKRISSTGVGADGVQVLMMGLERTYFYLFFLRRRFGSRLLEHGEPYEEFIRLNSHDHICELLSRGKGNEIWDAIKKKAFASDSQAAQF